MAQGDLTTLANVKAWLGIATTTSDATLGRLISAASTTVTRYLSRPYLGSTLITERVDGHGRDTISLRNGPVTSVVSIAYDGVTITTAANGNPPTGGYLIDPGPQTTGRVTITDDVFPNGRLNVAITYRAGYLISGEAHTAAASVTPSQVWLTDAGVTYANGTALALVTGTPAAGQYAVSSAGVYAFSAADVTASAAVLISYGYVPYDLEQAVIELVGEAAKRAQRIGIVSQSLGGQEVTTYVQKAFSDPVKQALAPFRRAF